MVPVGENTRIFVLVYGCWNGQGGQSKPLTSFSVLFRFLFDGAAR